MAETLIDIMVHVPIPGTLNPDSNSADMTLAEARQFAQDLIAALPPRKRSLPIKKEVKPKDGKKP